MRIAIFYHCLTQIEKRVLPHAQGIIASQMEALNESGLLAAAENFFVGFNGEHGTLPSTIPEKANVIYHGLKCRNELRTFRAMEKWLPGHEDWAVLYFHSKGATHKIKDVFNTNWRECSMRHLVSDWRVCVNHLKNGYDSVGVHWMTGRETPPEQSIWAGNMFWVTGKFLLSLPSILDRERVIMSGIDSLSSRYESEVYIGNGPALPVIKDFCPNWRPGREHVKVLASPKPVLA